MVCAVLIIPFSGCKKNKGFDPLTKGSDDFIGTWQGTISTFKNNKVIKEKGDVVIYRESADYLAGIIFMNETLSFTEFQFLNGTLYFRIPCNDPLNPNCQTWNLGGYAVFAEDGKIDFRLSGNECGSYGSEYVDWNGTLMQKQVDPDSIQYFDFARTGNSWTYKITLKNGDSCHVQKQIITNAPTWNFQGLSAQTCGWNAANMTLKWGVAPSQFSIVNDSTLSLKAFTIPINAKPGVVYKSVLHSDTTTLTLVDTNLTTTTAAGIFTCSRFKYTEPAYSGDLRYTKTAFLWLNNRYGIIRQEVENPADPTDIVIQVLYSKNF